MKVIEQDIVKLKAHDVATDISLVDLDERIVDLNNLHTQQGVLINNNKKDIEEKLDIEKARILLTESAIDVLDNSMADIQLSHLPSLDLSMNNPGSIIGSSR